MASFQISVHAASPFATEHAPEFYHVSRPRPFLARSSSTTTLVFISLPSVKRILIYSLLLLPAFAFTQDYLDQFPHRKQTEYFDFRYRSNSPRVAEIARFGDGFIKFVNRDFFKADFDYPIRVLVLEDRARFKEFIRREFQDNDPPDFGIYFSKHKLFATFEDSGLGTFAHEIMHPLVERNLRDRPEWAVEGIPTFFEKFYGYWTNDALVVQWGFQNPWRIYQLATNLTQLDLKQIISYKAQRSAYGQLQHNESKQRMVSVFLWQQGRFKRFLQLIATREKNGYPTYFEAAMEMPIERILPIWQDYLNNVATKRSEIMTLPGSTIFNSQAAFRGFAMNYGLLQENVSQH